MTSAPAESVQHGRPLLTEQGEIEKGSKGSRTCLDFKEGAKLSKDLSTRDLIFSDVSQRTTVGCTDSVFNQYVLTHLRVSVIDPAAFHLQ